MLPALAPLRLGCVLLCGPSVLWVWPLSPPWPRLWSVDFNFLLPKGPCVRYFPPATHE